MEKMRQRFLNIFKFLFALGIALCAFASCSNLGGVEELPNSNFAEGAVLQRGEGEGILNGSIFSENDCARTAMPTTPTVSSYEVIATNGASILTVPDSEIDKTSGNKFAILLSYGTWNITANAMDTSGKAVFTQTKTVTLSQDAPTVDLNFNLTYSQDAAVGPGKVDLTVKFPASSSFGIKTIDYSLYKGSSRITSGISEAEINSGSFKISHTVSALGAYNLVINFYDNYGAVLYRIDQIVNTYANLTTNKFESGAAYINSSGEIQLSDAMIAAFKFSTFYVGGTGIGGKAASDSNSGSQFAPLVSVQKAIEKIKAINDGITEYTIYVSGTAQAASGASVASFSGFASPTPAKVKIIGNGANATLKGNGSNVVFVSASESDLTLTLQNLILTGGSDTMGGGIYAGAGNITVQNCTISNNTATTNGGGIYNAGTGASLTMEETTVSNNTAATDGGGIYNAGMLEITGGTISGNTAATNGGGIYNKALLALDGVTFNSNTAAQGNEIWTDGDIDIGGAVKFGGDIYLAENTSVSANSKITITGNLTAATAGSIKITPAAYANDQVVLTESPGGTLVADNFTKFAVTDQVSGGNTIKWGVNSEGKLVPSLEVIYWKYVDGSDTNSGATSSEPVKTFSKVYTLISDATEKIVVIGASSISEAEITANSNLLNFSSRAEPITIQRYYDTATPNALIEIKGSLTINNIIFDGNKTEVPAAGSSSLIKIANSANVTLENTIVKNNAAASALGTINVDSGKLVIKSGCEIKDNTANNGGGVYVGSSGTLDMEGGTIGGLNSGNTATTNGGGVYVNGGTFNMSGGEVSSNTATNMGGGVYVFTSGTFTMTGGTISNNTAGYGGGVYVFSSGTFKMEGGTISGNTATNNGGGVLVSSGAFTMSDGEISGSNKAKNGGGVYVFGSTFTMTGGTISSNTATDGSGGGVYVGSGGTFTMNDGTISKNTATDGSGGGVYVGSGTFTMSGGEISGSNTAAYGGGVYVTSGTFEMEGGEISSNTATNMGGGVYVFSSGSTFTMTGGTISGNKTTGADGKGKGIYIPQNNTFSISGSAKIAEDNDVYLGDSSVITVAGALTETTVATITPKEYTAGTQVLAAGGSVTELTQAICNQFALSDTTKGFEIVPESTDTTKGVLVKPVVSGGITIDIPGSGTYVFKPTYGGAAVSAGDTLTYNSASSFAVTVTKNGSAIAETPTIELRDTGGNTLSIVPPLPGTHSYQLYMKVETGGVVVDQTIDISITNP